MASMCWTGLVESDWVGFISAVKVVILQTRTVPLEDVVSDCSENHSGAVCGDLTLICSLQV